MTTESKKNYLVAGSETKQNNEQDQAHNANLNTTKLASTIKQLVQDVQQLTAQRNDTTNLKNSYRDFVETYNVNEGSMNAKLSAIELLLKQLSAKLDAIENLA